MRLSLQQEGGHSVPDSCCITPSEGCGRGILNLARGANDQRIRNNIWVTGCIDALKYRLDNDVQNMMAVYAGVGVLIALIELIAVVLTSGMVTNTAFFWLHFYMGTPSIHSSSSESEMPPVATDIRGITWVSEGCNKENKCY